MAYDPSRSQVVLYGGTACAPPQVADPTGCDYQKEQTQLNDTWAWDGATWSQLHTAHSPAIQGFRGDFGGMADDESHHELLLVSWPTNSFKSTVETWRFRNGDWEQLHPKDPPAQAEFSGPTYDAASGHVILQQLGARFSVTYWWDGSDWNVFDLSAKTPHVYGTLLAAGAHGLLLIDPGGAYAWNGKSWSGPSQLPDSVSSLRHPREGWTAAYHEPTKELVLFGGRAGWGGPDLLGDTAGWDGTSWKILVPARSTPLGPLSNCSAQQSLAGYGNGPIHDPQGEVVEVDFYEPPAGPCHLHVDITMTVISGMDTVHIPGNPAVQRVDFDLVPGKGGIAAVFDIHGGCTVGPGTRALFEGGDFHAEFGLGYIACTASPAPLSITTSTRLTG